MSVYSRLVLVQSRQNLRVSGEPIVLAEFCCVSEPHFIPPFTSLSTIRTAEIVIHSSAREGAHVTIHSIMIATT